MARMKKLGIFFATLILFALLPAGVGAAPAEEAGERILSFQSHILVDPDASLTVTETIRVRSAGEQIKHGIYRDFPTAWRKWYIGFRSTVTFDVLAVRADGQPETFRVEEQGNSRRVYIGRSEVDLPPGEHIYELTYRTARQLHFDRDYDELYWNVTGNDWAFPIDEARAVVELPAGASAQAMRLDGFTGTSGSTEKAVETSRDADGNLVFRATRPLDVSEGLTIVATWPKGFVQTPTLAARRDRFMTDNRGTALGLAGLLFLLVYYLLVWAKVGRDPARGTIVPLFEPPANLSPAAVRYIARMGFDDRTVSAALVSLAVKGYLTIREEEGEFTLIRTTADGVSLSPDERSMARKMFAAGAELALTKSNHEAIKKGLAGLQSALKTAYEKSYFLLNQGYFTTGLAITAVLMIGAALLESGRAIPVVIFMGLWLTIWSIGVTGLVMKVISDWRDYFREQGAGRYLHLGAAIFTSLFALPFIGGEIFGLGVLTWATSFAVVALLFLAVAVNVVFYRLLKAPTLAGRRVLDGIEGFRMFLAATETDRLARMNPEGLTPQLFEKYLPYAIALDVERNWADRFSGVLAAATSAGSAGGGYAPAWYVGSSISSLGAAGMASSIGSSLGSSFTSSSSAPGSGGSGGSSGGGSSGGGGGGGGGGGW